MYSITKNAYFNETFIRNYMEFSSHAFFEALTLTDTAQIAIVTPRIVH